MRRLDEGATVLVTGGSSGLGAAVVEAVQAAGGLPIVLDRRKPSPGTAWEEVDLADGRTVERTVARIAARQPLDAVVTAAGIDSCGRLEDVPAEQWELVTRVNLFGIAAVVRAALPALTARRGRIVTVAST